jgi:hypothetical protein
MAVESEASFLRSSRGLGDDAKNYVKIDFVLVVYFSDGLLPFFLIF